MAIHQHPWHFCPLRIKACGTLCQIVGLRVAIFSVLYVPMNLVVTIIATLCWASCGAAQAPSGPFYSPITCWLASRARRARASQMTMYRFSWRVLQRPRHRCVRCIMMPLVTTVMSHENAPNIEFSYVSFGVWNVGNSWNQTLTIGKLFQSYISNYFCHIYQVSPLSEPMVFWRGDQGRCTYKVW